MLYLAANIDAVFGHSYRAGKSEPTPACPCTVAPPWMPITALPLFTGCRMHASSPRTPPGAGGLSSPASAGRRRRPATTHRAQLAEMPGCAPQGRRDARGGVEGRAARRRRCATITTSNRLTARAHAEAQLDAAARPPPPPVQVGAPRRRVPPGGREEGFQESETASPSSRTGSPGPAGPGGKRETG
jgi:hypothetical protein